jgi:glycosyltransferase involved in cell wall biosynthesis
MSRIVFADMTGAYDGRTLDERPLGGTESSVIRLARELAARGHEVSVHTRSTDPVEHEGVRWRSLSHPPETPCDLYVAVQQSSLLGFVARPARRALWVLWQPDNLNRSEEFRRMWRFRPIPILMSRVQQKRYPRYLPPRWGDILLPLGIPDELRGQAPLAEPPPRRAIFASMPARNLNRLVRVWAERILPRVPDAILDVYGVNVLDGTRDAWEIWEGRQLPAGLDAAAKASVRVHPSLSRAGLQQAMREARVMPYFGHVCEAFCLSLAEAQALGLPAVVARIGALPERVIDGVTGFHLQRDDEAGFAEATIALLTDDALWRRQHEKALALQQGWSWRDYAAAFEAKLLQ